MLAPLPAATVFSNQDWDIWAEEYSIMHEYSYVWMDKMTQNFKYLGHLGNSGIIGGKILNSSA